MQTLRGRIAVMTGANVQVMRALLEGDMKIVMLTHQMESAKKRIESLGELGKNCVAEECDVSNSGDVICAFEAVYKLFGSLDVVIASHGGNPPKLNLEEITSDGLCKDFNNIVGGSFNMIRYSLPYLEKSKAARVILTSSVEARMGGEDESLSNAVSRGAILSLTYGIARRLANKGITVNCIARGGVDEGAPRRDERTPNPYDMLGRIPVGRVGTGADMASAVCFLASEEAGYVTGQIIHVCGGLYMG